MVYWYIYKFPPNCLLFQIHPSLYSLKKSVDISDSFSTEKGEGKLIAAEESKRGEHSEADVANNRGIRD